MAFSAKLIGVEVFSQEMQNEKCKQFVVVLQFKRDDYHISHYRNKQTTVASVTTLNADEGAVSAGPSMQISKC